MFVHLFYICGKTNQPTQKKGMEGIQIMFFCGNKYRLKRTKAFKMT